MRRREFIAFLGGAATWPLSVRAQQRPLPVIGFLSGRSLKSDAQLVAAFRQGLKEAGYVDGQNVTIEYRWAEGQENRLVGLAQELVRNHAAVLFAGAIDIQIKALKNAIAIPAVFATGGDLVELGIVDSINRPGGNITGVTVLASELWAKQMGLLLELVGPTDTIGVLVNPNNVTVGRAARDMQTAARTINQKVLIVNARTESEFDAAFTTIAQQRTGGLIVSTDALFIGHREKVVARVAANAIPTIYPRREFSEAGGLMSYGSIAGDQYRDSGIYVGRILSGVKPSDLPVLQPTKFELVINLKTAKALSHKIPPTLLARADAVIE